MCVSGCACMGVGACACMGVGACVRVWVLVRVCAIVQFLQSVDRVSDK